MQGEKPAYYSLQRAGERKLRNIPIHSWYAEESQISMEVIGEEENEYIDKTDHSLHRKVIPKALVYKHTG